MTTPKDDFIVFEPLGKNKTYAIASRRIGSRQRFVVVATATSDTMAQRIVDGLASLQGEVLKLEVPAQRALAEVRAALSQERALTGKLRDDVRAAQRERDAEARRRVDVERLVESLQKANLEKA
jgi:hypothetical protein